MGFYAIISYIIGPLVGYYLGGRTLTSAGTGFVFGNVISIVLWYTYGQNLVIH
jgi:hypothetical protein